MEEDVHASFLRAPLAEGCFSVSGTHSRMSPGWHESAAQIASSVENRIARAFPVFRIERFTIVMPTRSASSVRVIPRACSTSSSLTTIAMSHGPVQVLAHQRAFGEDTREDEGQKHGNSVLRWVTISINNKVFIDIRQVLRYSWQKGDFEGFRKRELQCAVRSGRQDRRRM